MEWLMDPSMWLALVTLVVLEIILGIDILIFIAILADKLPPEQQDRARRLGLGLALFTRLALLASISWLTTLTAPLFTLFGLEFSGRDIVLVIGGAFLLVKATMEMHDRLEVAPPQQAGMVVYAGFGPVVAQIVVLDIVFSLDSVITAVGMVDNLYVMMAAVVIAIIMMIAASKPLTTFVTSHPSLIILCLGFLLMVGFVLVADGLGAHIPKGYLYAAIAFSLMIEGFNQLALRKRRKWAAQIPPRQRAADVVLRLLGAVPVTSQVAASGAASAIIPDAEANETFAPAEKEMVRGVLTLADRPVQTIMTPRRDIAWIDPNDPKEMLLAEVRDSAHRQFVVSRGSVDDVLGIARKEDILGLWLEDKPFDLMRVIRQPLAVREGASILETLDLFKRDPVDMALVIDEYGGLQGVVTQTDFLEAIAGNLPDAARDEPAVKNLGDGSMLVDGAMSIYDAQTLLELETLPDGDFNTLAGFVLSLFGHIPVMGENVEWGGWRFQVSSLDGLRLDKIVARRSDTTPNSQLASNG